MTLVDLITLSVPLSFLGLMAVEALRPARGFPARRAWRLLGLGFFVALVVVSAALPLVIPNAWLERVRLVDLSSLGVAASFALGWVVYTLLGYAWHRACHSFPFMWRAFHQMHHAPQRLDVASSAVFHPTEMIAYGLITLFCCAALGLDPVAAALLGSWAGVASVLQHANVRTPRFIGPLVQRPEAHVLHHRVGGPVGNYADLPLWDMLFGTYHNPRSVGEPVGFQDGADGRWAALLAFRDVSTPALEPARARQAA